MSEEPVLFFKAQVVLDFFDDFDDKFAIPIKGIQPDGTLSSARQAAYFIHVQQYILPLYDF